MIVNIATDGTATDGGDSADDSESERSGGETGVPLDSVSDPAALAERADVEATTATFEHGEADHCEADAGGRAIVGVTNERGEVLLWVHENGHAILPSVVVDAGGDWARAVREDVTETAGMEVVLDGVERVREIDHVLVEDGDDAGESRHLETTHHVVFAASPGRPADERDGPAIDTCDDVWAAGWYDHLPTDAEAVREGTVVDDIRLFTE
jgi:hypothetical protein